MLLGHKMVTCWLTSMVDSNLGLYSVQYSNLQTFGQLSPIRSDKIKFKAGTPQLLPAQRAIAIKFETQFFIFKVPIRSLKST